MSDYEDDEMHYLDDIEQESATLRYKNNQINELEAKVQELEAIIDHTFLIGKATSNQIKANAIEEMLIHFGLFDLDKDKHGFGEYLAELRGGGDE